VGFEFDDHAKDNIVGIPGVVDLVTSWDSHLAEDLGVISMIHVLEHIEDPRSLLRTAWSRLAPGGLLVVEVPHVWTNPYALTVSDHATHFGAASLTRLIRSAGFTIVWTGTDAVPGELTIVARRDANYPEGDEFALRVASLYPHSDFHAQLPQKLVNELVATSEWLVNQRMATGTLGILGTSIAGTWAGATIDLSHDIWVDEDHSRAGLTWLGKSVYPPGQVPRGARVLAMLAPSKAHPAAKRLTANYAQFSIHIPPTFVEPVIGAGLHLW